MDSYGFVGSPTITAPAGLFTVVGDVQSVDVYTVDVTPTGPGGESYTVTVNPSSPCNTSPVTYTVNIVNSCETASFAIDSAAAVFMAPGTPSATHSITEATTTLVWDETVELVSTITWVDPCGAITQELVDVSSGVESPLLSPTFTISTSGT